MNNIWHGLGRVAFFLSIPLLHIYLRSHKRTRVFIISEGKVLLVKGWLGSGRWILPGGGRHRNESAEDAVVRELKEETGIILSKELLQDMGEVKFARYGLRYTYQQFIATLPTAVEPTIRKPEIIDAMWMPLEAISEQSLDKDVLTLLGEWKRIG